MRCPRHQDPVQRALTMNSTSSHLQTRRLWHAFWVVIVVSFAILSWAGLRIYQQKPPLPRTVIATDNTVMISEGVVSEGQNVWQTMGGMEMGSIWGHGSYVAPDWTADYL